MPAQTLPPPASSPALDPEIFEGLRALADDGDDFVTDLFRTFLDSVGDHLRSLRSTASAGDGPGFERAAHTLKGAAANVGATHLAALAEELQRRGERAELAGVDAWLDAIAAEAARVRTAAEAVLPGLAPDADPA